MPSLLHKYKKLYGNRFCTHICVLPRRWSKQSRNQLLKDHITNKMAIHLYVIGPLVKDRIVGYVNSNLVITVHRHQTIHAKFKFPQEGFQLYHLTNCMSHSSIICFSTGTRHNILLLTPLSNQITSNISAVARSRLSISFISCIIQIWYSFNSHMSMLFIQQIFTWRPFDVSENSQGSLPMNLSRFVHKLTH